MHSSLRLRTLLAVVPLVLIPLACGLVFLAQNATRDWSLHWASPQVGIANTSSVDYAGTNTPRGFDVLWMKPSGAPVVSHFDTNGRRLTPDTVLRGTPEQNSQSLTIGYAGGADVAIWREDLNTGSRLRAAIIRPGEAPVYRTLASGTWSLEHPRAFTAGNRVDVVFSWQRSVFDVYLAGVDPSGTTMAPRRLTSVGTYAFNPHAAVDGQGTLHVLYMVTCCGQSAMKMTHARFTLDGTPIGKPQSLDTITAVGSAGQGSTPTKWGLDVQRDGNRVLAVWAGDRGLTAAAWSGASTVVPPHIAVPGLLSEVVALSAVNGYREVIWRQPFDLGQMLSYVPLSAAAMPLGVPDRVDFEAASADSPVGVSLHGRPGVVWQASPAKSDVNRMEFSRFSPATLSAPSVWAQIGLGLSNPIGSIAILLFGGLAVAVLLTAANILIVLALVLLYMFGLRAVPPQWKWYAYSIVLAVILFALFVKFDAPSPPVLFLTDLSLNSGLLALGGMLAFLFSLARFAFKRIDDVYRAGAMAFAGFFFIAFLQALVLMEGQIGRI